MRCPELHPLSADQCRRLRGHSNEHVTKAREIWSTAVTSGPTLPPAPAPATPLPPNTFTPACNDYSSRLNDVCTLPPRHTGSHLGHGGIPWSSKPKIRCSALHPAYGERCWLSEGHSGGHAVGPSGPYKNMPWKAAAVTCVGCTFPYSDSLTQCPACGLQRSALSNGPAMGGPQFTGIRTQDMPIMPTRAEYEYIGPNRSTEKIIEDYLNSPRGQEFLAKAVLTAMDSVASKTVGGG